MASCESGKMQCKLDDPTCFDLQNDPKHCGSCDKACSDGSGCSGGKCTALFLYAASYGTKEVYTFQIMADTGSLKFKAISETGANPQGIAANPTAKCLYATNLIGGTVTEFQLKQGIPVPQQGAPTVAAQQQPFWVVVDPSGKYVYVTNYQSNNILGYTIDPATCALAPMNAPFAAGMNPTQVVINAKTTCAYVANRYDTDKSISVHSIDDKGALTYKSKVSLGKLFTDAIALHPNGKCAYAVNDNTPDPQPKAGTVYSFTVDAATCALTPVPKGEVSAGLTSQNIIIHPSGKWAYVVNHFSNSVTGFSIDESTCALSPLSQPINGYELDGKAKDQLPWGITIEPTGKFLYTGDVAANGVSGFKINPDGTLAALISFPVAAGTQPFAVTTAAVFE